MNDWNNELEENAKIIEQANQALKAEYDRGEISVKGLLEGWQPVPKKVTPPRSNWGRWFLKQYGWSLLSRAPDSQSWLPFDCSEMIQARDSVRKLTTESGVHAAMILNYDQLWRNSWSFSGKLLMKDRATKGLRRNRTKTDKHTNKKLHTVKGNRRSVTVSRLQG